MQNRVFSQELVNQVVDELKITNLENATIGEVLLLASRLEQATGIPFIRMDQGVPGLKPCRIGLDAEKEALDKGVASMYPAAEGIPVLKNESARFVKAFLDIDVSPASCIPVTGSVAGSFGAFIACNQRDREKDTVLFIDPGFPIQKSQLKVLGINYLEFDIHDFRGEKLREKLESYLKKGNISSIIYSNPNNPAWICLTESELKIIGELATQYDTIVLEDLAYFGMDFRTDFGHPFRPPYIPTVARYTDNYILMLSSSKIFSYAGQRAAVVCVSDKLFSRKFEALAERYSGAGIFGPTFVASILYMITSGTTHTTQYGYAAMLKAASDGQFNFVEETSEYARRAKRMKDSFRKYGFRVVYDKDIDRDISDGFFFTIGYKDMSCGELMQELLYYGISSIALSTTGSRQQGIRACCSRMSEELYDVLDERLKAFAADH
ncbi:pyridoxal phosphate-dependent aminotransferase [Dysgonomonas sp. 511]|uniref:aminotransferase class I/II-fold pyridoxal phosphate-dependent enzyme n=1 Tax=Dysgonomonas sp. 511 TaxID=2302930 RepID=UPI0013D553D5|nr:pyridoxal phosphate-dependent aminotransferase [Dysgonomonas sp. 511]NDV78270.1 pyridoxal phosphate-dependent aminotransferase [Dysgonomonas sp. 511]